ncbi:hypothetical protein UFOVP1329_31 [uncultured Caudovirales phage]|uniref:Uncharacterized protein n=1 Tax=uncultured Caudovirales phage TaxID=2100421 RepID=A0A6J5QVI6_9CAUD|nr:hypothetical protein UFOVP1150_12 [uncultured Caudovirales phage]CAB4199239.1 hypothetical protein UFOVP1329_31 [uncultured Caudovirales phage]CAB4218243.1 hypothetical protein UFOVP1595_5 [uncultured Caudovirales phage]
MKLTKAQKNAVAAAINDFGKDACVRAYKLNVNYGEGGTVIEINTGIPNRRQTAAIRAGECIIEERIAEQVVLRAAMDEAVATSSTLEEMAGKYQAKVTPPTTTMTLPTIHLNGTGKETLIKEIDQAYDSISQMMGDFARITCHARDYYPQGEDAYPAARQQRQEMFDKLVEVNTYIDELRYHLHSA